MITRHTENIGTQNHSSRFSPPFSLSLSLVADVLVARAAARVPAEAVEGAHAKHDQTRHQDHAPDEAGAVEATRGARAAAGVRSETANSGIVGGGACLRVVAPRAGALAAADLAATEVATAAIANVRECAETLIRNVGGRRALTRSAAIHASVQVAVVALVVVLAGAGVSKHASVGWAIAIGASLGGLAPSAVEESVAVNAVSEVATRGAIGDTHWVYGIRNIEVPIRGADATSWTSDCALKTSAERSAEATSLDGGAAMAAWNCVVGVVIESSADLQSRNGIRQPLRAGERYASTKYR